MAARKGIDAPIFIVAEAAFVFEAALAKLSAPESDCYCGEENPFSPAEVAHLMVQFLIVRGEMLEDVKAPCQNVADHFLKVAYEAQNCSSSPLYCQDQWMECWAPMSSQVDSEEVAQNGMSKAEAERLDVIVSDWQVDSAYGYCF